MGNIKTSEEAARLLLRGTEACGGAHNYEYYYIKDRLRKGIEEIDEAIEVAEDDGITDGRLEDMKTVRDMTEKIAEAEAPLERGRVIQYIIEFGLYKMLVDPKDIDGYEDPVDPDELGLKAEEVL